MPYRNLAFQTDHYYRLCNRSNNGQPVFFERDNHVFFLRQLPVVEACVQTDRHVTERLTLE